MDYGDGRDAGFYERAAGSEICGYYDEVMRHRFLASGRVRFMPMTDYLGSGRLVSRLSGNETQVSVRRNVVDATYMATRVPATDAPPFEVVDGVRCVPVGDLTKVATPPVRAAKVATQKRETKQTPPAPRIATVNQEYVGSLRVMSEPAGATVRIDGQTVGTTPLQLDRVRVGSHAVHVALDGYPAWSAAATVVYGKSNGVLARLGR